MFAKPQEDEIILTHDPTVKDFAGSFLICSTFHRHSTVVPRDFSLRLVVRLTAGSQLPKRRRSRTPARRGRHFAIEIWNGIVSF
jgi:hypothetical protein